MARSAVGASRANKTGSHDHQAHARARFLPLISVSPAGTRMMYMHGLKGRQEALHDHWRGLHARRFKSCSARHLAKIAALVERARG